jgi:mannitol/fructose-specific phosphotransferase system IIA component
MINVNKFKHFNSIEKCNCSFCQYGDNEIHMGKPQTKKVILCQLEIGQLEIEILEQITIILGSKNIVETLRFLIHYGAFHVQISKNMDVET